MANPKIVFGMNSLFAVRHLVGETLSFLRGKAFDVIVVAPPPGAAEAAPLRGLDAEFYPIPIQREISPA